MSVKEEKLIVDFRDVRREHIPLVGGKVANLGEMLSIGIPVPPGFAVTAYAYKKFIEETGLQEKIFKLIKESGVKPSDPEAYATVSEKIRKLVEETPMPEYLRKAIAEAYHKLSSSVGLKNTLVAVRSSATAEDLPDASFAGQHDTYLNVSGEKALIEHIQKCWSSLFTPRAIFYREQKGFEHGKVFISVAVQKMVNSRVAGVMFTINPTTGDRGQIVIEGSWGLGEAVVSGSVTPDHYVVDKETLQILERKVAKKHMEIVRDPKTGENVHLEVPPDR
ncbi:MAG: phosphoenolpyruvate synthase, partial [Candidatus Hecatellales archaeon]